MSAEGRVLLSDGVVRTEVVDSHILLITLNRPDARNAVNREVAAALGHAAELLNTDPNLHIGVLTGTGAAFCAGMDLKAFANGQSPWLEEHPEWGFAGFVGHHIARPMIAAVNGFAFGGGFELVLSCDLVVASKEARFALPEATRGLIAGGGGLPRLAQQIPARVAARMVYTGEPLDAAEALRWGLVNEVVAADELLDVALVLAAKVATQAPLAISTTKRMLADLTQLPTWTPEFWKSANESFRAIMRSDDALEGARAFAEKRSPRWSGR